MKALILLGGLGTRLRPLTLERPKPLLPILNRPFLSYQIDLLKRYGVRDVVLALGHQSAHFRWKLGNGRAWGVRFVYSVEKEPLGTGGAIRLARRYLIDRTIVLNGDIFSDFDLSALVSRHERCRAEATLALVAVENPAAYGLVQTRADGTVTRFLEKPTGPSFPCRTINAGCYLFEPTVVDAIPPGRPVSVEREVFPGLLAAGRRLVGWHHKGYWSDIGTLSSYWATQRDLLEAGRVPRGTRRVGKLWLDRGAKVASSVRNKGLALLGIGARLEADVQLSGRVVIGPGARIGVGVQLSDCVILEGARIEPRAVVTGTIVGPNVTIGADTRVGPGQVLGSRSRLTPFSGVWALPAESKLI